MEFQLWHYILLASAGVLAVLLALVLAEPGLPYRVNEQLPPVHSHELLGLLVALADAPVGSATTAMALTDGHRFYPQMLTEISRAHRTIHLEAYVFHVSDISGRFVAALTERARAGVQVRLVIDAIGSWLTPDSYFDELRAAGGRVAWYQPIRWYTLKRFNNRTHRELLIVDGDVAFAGGAGIASWWDEAASHLPPWRDMMMRLDGPVVTSLQSVFAENWLESTGELLADAASFPHCRAAPTPHAQGIQTMVVAGTPSAGKATRTRMLFQLLVASARVSICIQSPYFLPDRSMRIELRRAAERGVRICILVPGQYNNHPIARRASRRRYGELLRAGIEILEYQPGMNHTKLLIVDDAWAVIGSSNFDNRSFGLNDEVNVMLADPQVTERLRQDFDQDVHRCSRVSMADWQARPLTERLLALLGILLERQQ